MVSGDWELAERLLYESLSGVAEARAYTWLSDPLECLARVALHQEKWATAARLLGAASAARSSTGTVRFGIYQGGYDADDVKVREALTVDDFEAAWAEGAALSLDEAIAFGLRGRGERKRPATGWASLTPAELDVVNLVSEGLTNKDVAARLFISPRTVQSHLAHVFTKLDVTTRTQLAQEASRNV